jgi:hypothetical protein
VLVFLVRGAHRPPAGGESARVSPPGWPPYLGRRLTRRPRQVNSARRASTTLAWPTITRLRLAGAAMAGLSRLEDGVERAGHDAFLELRLRHFLDAALFYAGSTPARRRCSTSSGATTASTCRRTTPTWSARFWRVPSAPNRPRSATSTSRSTASGADEGDPPGDRALGPAEAGAEITSWLLPRATVGLCAPQAGVTERGWSSSRITRHRRRVRPRRRDHPVPPHRRWAGPVRLNPARTRQSWLRACTGLPPDSVHVRFRGAHSLSG